MPVLSVNPTMSTNRLRVPVTTALLVASPLLAAWIAGCDKPSAAPAPAPAPQTQSQPDMPVPSDTKPVEPSPADAKPADGMKVMKEFWPNGKLKYYNEMRRNAAGKWMKNGIGRAYYDHGVLEREGTYKDDVRVGQWKYYDQEGKLNRTEERGDGVAH